MKVIFVCTGNTCRSPMAEGFFNMLCRADGKSDVSAVSRGICAQNGAAVSHFSVVAATEYGTDISSHSSLQLTYDDIVSADYIFTMTTSHKEAILHSFPEFSDKVFSMSEFAEVSDIPDPYGGDLSIYRESAKSIFGATEKIYNKLFGK